MLEPLAIVWICYCCYLITILLHIFCLFTFFTQHTCTSSRGDIYTFIGGDKEEYYTCEIKYIIREGGRVGGGSNVMGQHLPCWNRVQIFHLDMSVANLLGGCMKDQILGTCDRSYI